MKKIIYSAVVILFVQFTCFSQENEKKSITSNRYLTHLIDSIVTSNMEKYNVPGVSYAIVKNNEIVYLGSQGFANIEKQKKVTHKTQFMLGSIAKLFTTIAVLQLYEDGRLDLDEDINTYIKAFQIPYKVTLRQLLTHTGGLEESTLDRVKLSSEEVSSLESYLKNHLPEQILEPWIYPAYSNHGMALAGLVVQEVSKLRFEDYIQKHIFTPIGMINSTFLLDSKKIVNLAVPYNLKDKKLTPLAYEYVETAPSAMLISTSEDMAKFMQFQLNPQRSKILKPATLQLMQQRQFTAHKKLWGRGFGFFERKYRGVDLLEHGGSRAGFYGQFSIVPKDTLGIFIISNGGSSRFRTRVTFDFLKKIYPKKKADKKFTQEDIKGSEYKGIYLSNRRTVSDFSKLILQATFVEKIKVKTLDSKTLSVLGSNYQMESPDQFNISNDSLSNFPIAFGRDKKGRVDALFLPGRSDSLRKMKWYEHEELAYVIFAIGFIVFLVISIRSLIKFKNKSITFQLKKGLYALPAYRFLYSILSSIFMLVLICLLLIVGETLQYRIPNAFYLVFSISTMSIPILIIAVLLLFKQWKNLNFKSKIYNSLFIILAVSFSLELFLWNLIGFNF